MNFTATAFFLLNIVLASITVLCTAQPPSAEEDGGCTDKFVSFSPCLPYVSAPPNNSSSLPTSACCGVYYSISNSGEASCLCYLLHEPSMLGFPLDVSRLLSLSSTCQRRHRRSGSLEPMCSDLKAESPLQSTGARAPPPPTLESDESPPPPSSSSNESPTPSSNSSQESTTPPSSLSHEIPRTPPSSSAEDNPGFSSAAKSAAATAGFDIRKSSSTSWFLHVSLWFIGYMFLGPKRTSIFC